MTKFSYALPSGYDWDINQFTRQVKTKAFVKRHTEQLKNIASRLTTANCDKAKIIGGMLQIAYGANIGKQIENKLTISDIDKIADNILTVIYYS